MLVEMLERALKLREDGQLYWDIARDLMRFSKIDQLIPSDQHRQHLVSYYERIRNFDGCSKNQFFWLQYAIARISLKEYPIADKYLETAFSLASRIRDFDTYQLDNTKARLILQRCIDNPDTRNAFADFRDAHRILDAQMRVRSHGYYPFRVATLYGEFWRNLVTKWEDGQRLVFLTACENVLQKVNRVDRHLSNHASVVKCRDAMERILKAST